MTLKNFTLYHYDIPLLDKALLKKREGIFVEVRDDKGNTGIGEVAPLPDFSRETLKESKEQLLRLQEEGSEEDLLPSVCFGLEMAMLDLTTKQRGISMRSFLADSFHNKIAINRLLLLDDPDALLKARKFVGTGCKTIKVKAGRHSVVEDAKVLQRICHGMGADVSLRVDPNGKWNLDEALKFAKLCSGLPIEYVEDPVQDPRDLHEFAVSSGMKFALDGILRENRSLNLSEVMGLEAVIIKPTLLGGFEATRQMVKNLDEVGVKVVISSAFESSVGILSLANLAAAVCAKGVAVGLDTFSFFADDALTPPLFYELGDFNLTYFDESTCDLSKEWIKRI
jgi:o-succinylbenzoate synthase